jgi:hypothetical protein
MGRRSAASGIEADMAAKKSSSKKKGGGGRVERSLIPSIYDEFGHTDAGQTYASAIYMARAERKRAEEEAAIRGRRLVGEELKAVNRAVAQWLLKAWSRYLRAYPAGERIRVPFTGPGFKEAAERWETLEPTIDQCSMFPEERRLLSFALPMAVAGADGDLYLPDPIVRRLGKQHDNRYTTQRGA